MKKSYTYLKIWLVGLLGILSLSTYAQSTTNLTTVQPATTPSGATFEWHSAIPVSAANLMSGTSITAAGPGIYYAVYNYGTCYSVPTPFKVITNTCPSATVDLTASVDSTLKPTGMVVTYHSATPATLANTITGSPKTVGTAGEYYISYYDPISKCYSASTPVIFINSSCCVVTTPTALAASPTSICTGGTTTLTANCGTGTLTWYSDASLTTIVTNPVSPVAISPATTVTYYAACVVSSTCISTAANIVITVNPSPTLTLSSTTCSADYTTYSITFSSTGTVTSTGGVVSGSTVTGITAGMNVTLTATSATGNCTTTLAVTAPTCGTPCNVTNVVPILILH